jgi:hypothetical protein
VTTAPFDHSVVNVRRWLGLSSARAAAIRSLPTQLTLRDLRSGGFLLHQETVRDLRLELFYALFEWINREALVVLGTHLAGIRPILRSKRRVSRSTRDAVS